MTAADWASMANGLPAGALTQDWPDGTNSVPPPENTGCPSGMTESGPYACIAAVKDDGGNGHLVIIRQGRSGSSGFGYLHALVDHNLDLGPMELTIGNAGAGVAQGNDRFLYGEFHTAPKGQIDQYVEIVEDRSGSSAADDSRELGLLTGYCRNSGRVEENQCPDWVNQTL